MRYAYLYSPQDAWRLDMRGRVVLLGLLLLFPVAAAQVPTPTFCGPIDVTAAAPATALAPGESGTVTITITNSGSVAIRASASILLEANVWDYDADASAQTIPPGESRGFAFQVTPREEAIEDVRASAVGRATCQSPAGGDCPLDACQLEEATSFTVRFREPEGLDIPFLRDLAIPPEYLVASLVLVGLVGGVVLLARRPTRGLAAECPEPLKLVRPGRGASFPIEVKNGAQANVTARFEVAAVPAGWSAFMPLPDVQLAPRESRNLFLMVRAPEDAIDGDAVDVEVRIRDVSEPGKPTNLRVRAEVSDTVA